MGISCYYLIVEIRVAPAKELTEGASVFHVGWKVTIKCRSWGTF